MMDKLSDCSMEAMDYLVKLGVEKNEFKTVEIDGETYVNTDKLVRVDKVDHKAAASFNVFTLNGLIDWIKSDVDKNFEKYGKLIVAVEDERTVSVYTPTYGSYNNVRSCLAKCVCDPCKFRFGANYLQEDFIVALQALFVKTEISDSVGAVVGNLRAESAVETADDGISQRVAVKTGIARTGNAVVENPVYLAPFRTFVEIEQPESPFVLRIKSEEGSKVAYAALHEADGGLWRTLAVSRIADYLRGQLEDMNVVVIA